MRKAIGRTNESGLGDGPLSMVRPLAAVEDRDWREEARHRDGDGRTAIVFSMMGARGGLGRDSLV